MKSCSAGIPGAASGETAPKCFLARETFGRALARSSDSTGLGKFRTQARVRPEFQGPLPEPFFSLYEAPLPKSCAFGPHCASTVSVTVRDRSQTFFAGVFGTLELGKRRSGDELTFQEFNK